ncbi:hypothetical protein ACFX13_031129 [Malus domestica]
MVIWGTGFVDWITRMAFSLSKDSFELLLFMVWSIWNDRNSLLWWGVVSSPGDIHFRIKGSFDGAWDEHRQMGGCGVVVRDTRGEFVAAKVQQFEDECSPLLPESLAARATAKFAEKLRDAQLQLEGDALMVVASIQKEASANFT